MIQFLNDLLVWKTLCGSACEQILKVHPIIQNALRVILGDKIKLLVDIDIGANVFARGNCLQNLPNCLNLIRVGDDGFYARL